MRKISSFFSFIATIALVACSSPTINSTTGDEDDVLSSSSNAKSSSSVQNDKDSSSSVLEDGEKCIGEPGKPWDGTTAKDFACGSGTKLNPYIIKTAEQLAHLSFVIGAKDADYLEKNYKLGADIVLNDGEIINEKGGLAADSTKLHKWTPIGNSSVAFAGNFDGAGHTVSGMFINTTSTHNGLFGHSSGTVQNLTVENGWVMGGKYTAGIVGMLKGESLVKNVVNKSSINGTEATAGIVAATSYVYGKKGKIEDSKNYGIIKGGKLVAGIIASTDNGIVVKNVENHGLIEGNYGTGGIAGHFGSSSDIENAFNDAEIVGKEFSAGILSYFGHGYCTANTNYGSVKNVRNVGKVVGSKYVAGIVGESQCVTIKRVVNDAPVEGDMYVAGVSGYAERIISESVYNTGDALGKTRVGGLWGYLEEGITSSAYSTGKVNGDSLVGLMIGYNYNTTMADYYYLRQGEQKPFGLNNGGGVATPKTEEEMKSQEFAELLGDDFVYDLGRNNGYPVLRWENK